MSTVLTVEPNGVASVNPTPDRKTVFTRCKEARFVTEGFTSFGQLAKVYECPEAEDKPNHAARNTVRALIGLDLHLYGRVVMLIGPIADVGPTR